MIPPLNIFHLHLTRPQSSVIISEQSRNGCGRLSAVSTARASLVNIYRRLKDDWEQVSIWLHTVEPLACENSRFSSLLAAWDASPGETSAPQRQKFHTYDVNQCLHNQSGSHGVPNAILFDFMFFWSILVKFSVYLLTSSRKTQMLRLDKNIFHEY